jgi:hypothetical protein
MKLKSFLKNYFCGNLYLFLPIIFSLILFRFVSSLFYYLIENDFIPLKSSACDMSAGGGSINLCDNSIWKPSLIFSLITTPILGVLVSQLSIKLLKVKFRSPWWSLLIIYFMIFVCVVNVVIGTAYYSSQVDIYYKITQSFGPLWQIIPITFYILPVLTLVFIIMLSILNYFHYKKLNVQKS